jgi:hypothetical protein
MSSENLTLVAVGLALFALNVFFSESLAFRLAKFFTRIPSAGNTEEITKSEPPPEKTSSVASGQIRS